MAGAEDAAWNAECVIGAGYCVGPISHVILGALLVLLATMALCATVLTMFGAWPCSSRKTKPRTTCRVAAAPPAPAVRRAQAGSPETSARATREVLAAPTTKASPAADKPVAAELPAEPVAHAQEPVVAAPPAEPVAQEPLPSAEPQTAPASALPVPHEGGFVREGSLAEEEHATAAQQSPLRVRIPESPLSPTSAAELADSVSRVRTRLENLSPLVSPKGAARTSPRGRNGEPLRGILSPRKEHRAVASGTLADGLVSPRKVAFRDDVPAQSLETAPGVLRTSSAEARRIRGATGPSSPRPVPGRPSEWRL